MKNIIRKVTLLSIISAMAVSMTACKPTEAPMEVKLPETTTTVCEETTIYEETSVAETTPEETTAPAEEKVEKVYVNGEYCERYYDVNGEVRKMDIYKEDGTTIDRSYERTSGDNWYFTKYNENGTIVSQDLAKFVGEGSRYIFKRMYNESGKLIIETRFDESGDMISLCMSEDDGITYTTMLIDYYDDKSTRTIKNIEPDKSYSIEYYRENGPRISRYCYDTEGVFTHYFEYDNNEDGKATRTTKYSPDGVMINYSLIKYDKNGNQTEVKTYTPDGKLIEE
ncbi:MAG: hypothetical protein J5992_08620 [Oscillospiraceae bacterium]|nr:hypothetical protein [Oscillospiraceae bacterium]